MTWFKSVYNTISSLFNTKVVDKDIVIADSCPTIREAILSQQDSFSIQTIVEITGKSRDSIGKMLRELRDSGHVVKMSKCTWKKKVEFVPEFKWSIPEVGSMPSLITDGKTLNSLIRKTILSKDKLFTIPQIRAQLRIDDTNGRIQRVIYGLVKEGLVVNTREKDLTHTNNQPFYYKVINKKGK